MAAAHAREAELHASLEQLVAQHRGAVAQHAAAVGQYEAAAAQLAHAEEQLRGGLPQDPALGPSVLISSLPKSGSIYQLNLFQKGLGYAARNVSPGYFPHDHLDWTRLRDAARGGVIAQSHFDASPLNLQALRLLQPRVQVHLRDPRQATLSMAHHLRRFWELYRDPGVMLCVEPAPAPALYDLDFTAQLDWMLDHYLPGCIRWIGEWLAVADGPPAGVEVLLTSFDDMVRDEPAFARRTLEFFGIPEAKFNRPALEKTMAVHFRKGEADEWKRVFTQAQQERASALIPAAWKDRFGWPA